MTQNTETTHTHWKKLHNPDYLGAYSLDPGKDLILTIRNVVVQTVTGPDNRKEECPVLNFVEPSKPMILNVTNSKAIQKLYKTPFIEEWAGKKIQIYSAEVKAFGDVVDALRIRPFIPSFKEEEISLICSDCKEAIVDFQGASAKQIAKHTAAKYGEPLCAACAQKRTSSKTDAAPNENPEETEAPNGSDT